VLHYSTDPLVSRDIIGDPASCVFDSGLTQTAGKPGQVFGWYDNEWGYTSRLVDLAAIVGSQLYRSKPGGKTDQQADHRGTDGSGDSLRAVEWAAREAALRRAPLQIRVCPALPRG